MEAFYRTHQYLLSHLSTQLVRRGLMDEIDWSERLIGIKGSRGIGKTTFLLSYAKEFYGTDNRECLYINLNHFFFTERSIVDFAGEFRAQGGKTLLLDQVFKYAEWSKELRICYDRYPDLKIVFTGPAVLRLKEENPDLSGKVAVYQLRGFSFREYLNQTLRKQFPSYSLHDILNNHPDITRNIAEEMNGKLEVCFNDYLHHGFYPFFLEKRNYSENLLKTMNMTLEVDVLYIKQIEQRYLPKLRKLFYLFSQEAPCMPNVSRLSKELDMSRATVMNYIKYMKDARLINMLYPAGEDFPKKPSTIYIYNTNLLHVVLQESLDKASEYKTFFYNQAQKCSEVNGGIKNADFTVDNQYLFCIKTEQSFKNNPGYYYVVNTDTNANENINTDRHANREAKKNKANVIPLWLFGFLY